MKKLLIILSISILILVILGYGFLKLINSRDFQFFGGIINQVETTDKVVALTFDDGPTENTDAVLKALDDAGVKATFFLTGNEIEDNPYEAKRLAEAGHELGNHSYSHDRMVFKSPSFVEKEIEDTDQLIREAGYDGPIQFRPPFGKKFIFLPYYLDKNNRNTILWNIEPDSYPEIASDSKNIVENVKQNVQPGSIILLHVMYDSRGQSLESIKGIVAELKKKGYIFKTVSELLEMEK
jgi:peptidoglycan-N-acetylglucosamine deacetylase